MPAEHRDKDLERLVMLVDAALAITLTLLMLDIRLPTPAAELGEGALASALLDLWPHYFAYALSFVVIGRFWMIHRRTLRRIVRDDAGFTWLNILFLLTLGAVPFATDLIAENGGKVATAVYAGAITGVSACMTLMWWYACRHDLVAADFPKDERREILVGSFAATAIFGASIGIAFLQADAAKYFWLALLLPPAIQSRLKKRRAKPGA